MRQVIFSVENLGLIDYQDYFDFLNGSYWNNFSNNKLVKEHGSKKTPYQ